MGGTVSWITIAPVKSLALQPLDEVRLELRGASGDRQFFFLDDEGRLVNAERFGRLVGVQARYDSEANTLELRFPNGDVVASEVHTNGEIQTAIYHGALTADAVVGPWAEAVGEWIGRPVQLVRPHSRTATDRGEQGGVTFVSTASLDALAAEAGCDGVDGRRFRMLFGVDGIAAHGEDAWVGHDVRVGEALVKVHGNVGRCVVTTLDPDTGDRDLDTLHTLTRYRGEVETTERLPFGVWGQVLEPGTVRLGDRVAPA
jgi:uncharacterized protein YcbX